ncbi:GNAT family N-acetyltransferase [Actinoplanes bogorensis]|uniref:GNAT family N-acetyltransferase n=1 Tax=Paractinoplanes bogorensis TaxID=1610840 RepID=A0ABS5YVC2_9ACTN|nr:GNAT family N-acetyltransferase [Actinoplanes bogorensis]MBU2666634.1 GNAT family N-acetyltransferase [Actinoplanes bogorensis]
MVDTAALLTAYDEHMRTPPGPGPAGLTYEPDGPVIRVVGGHEGRIRAPRDLGLTGDEVDRLIARQRDYFRARGEGVEWKVRGHDRPADLGGRLTAAGFTAEPPSAVLIGLAEEVAAEPVLPDGVVLRATQADEDLRRIADQQTEVWGFDLSWVADDLRSQVAAAPDRISILIAEAGDRLVTSAWAVFHPSHDYVALLGGTTVPEWRGRGLYRALLAARAGEAAARGCRLLHVDASPDSAPILRRLGFHEITTSTHYRWTPIE